MSVPQGKPGESPSQLTPLPPFGPSVELLRRAQEGDSRALDDLIRRYEERVRRVVRIRMGAQLRGAMESCDLVQETLRVAADKLPAFEPKDQGALLRWLAVIAENQIRAASDKLRAEKRDRGREVPFPTDTSQGPGGGTRNSPSSLAAAAELQEIYDACVAALPEAYRELILLRDYEESTWEEIAERLGAPSGHAMEQKYYRAQVKLGELLRLRTG